ncbi:MAG: hypothetical protein EHM61_00665 [Acidobacteria bacterium]|nr:MAG: hypothetical protein EHM61_00665 [Acidobacteriota bacterium]
MPDTNTERWRDRSPFALLTRHFFSRFFDSEFLSPGGEASVSVTQILALLPVPGAVLSLYYIFMKYAFLVAHLRSWAAVDSWSDRCFFVSISMIVTGLVTLLYWDNLFPDGKDYLNLVPLPIKLSTLFLAKVSSLVLFMGMFSVMINAASGILFPLAATISYASSADSMRFLAAHFVAVFSGSGFVFLLLVGVQGACMTILPRRLFNRVSVAIQSSLLVVFLSSFLVLSDLIVSVRNSHNPLYQVLFLPAWFTALYDHVLGIIPRHATSVSWRYPLLALMIAFALSVLFYSLSYRRYVGRCQQASTDDQTRSGLAGRFLSIVRKLITKEPEQSAAFDFVAATLSRSARHRMVLGSCLGVALAFCLAAVFLLVARFGEATLYRLSLTGLCIPPMLYFFLLGGVRLAFTLPSELSANWVFRTSAFRPAVYWTGVRAALLTLIVTPVFCFSLLLFASLWGWSTGWRVSLLELMSGIMLMERLFLTCRKVPFACAYLPGAGDLKLRWPVYLFASAAYLFATAGLGLVLATRPWAYGGALVVGLLAIRHLATRRQTLLRTSLPIFEEQPHTDVLTLFSGLPGTFLEQGRATEPTLTQG